MKSPYMANNVDLPELSPFVDIPPPAAFLAETPSFS